MKPKNWTDWTEESQEALFNAINLVELMLRQVIHVVQITQADYQKTARPKLTYKPKPHTSHKNQISNHSNSALDKLCEAFGLNYIERQTLVLVAGAELIPRFRQLCASATGVNQPTYPTFELAFKLFGADQNRQKINVLSSNKSALLDWELVKFKFSAEGRQFKTLEIEDKVLDYLLGYPFLDKRLENLVFPVANFNLFPKNIESIKNISLGITRALNSSLATQSKMPVIQLHGNSLNLKQQIINSAIKPLEFSLYELPWNLFPVDSLGLEKFYLLWTREAVLEDYVLLLNCENIGQKDSEQLKILNKFLTLVDVPIIVSTSERLSLSARYTVNFEIPDLSRSEQHELWQLYLGEKAHPIAPQIESIVANFKLDPQEIYSAVNSSLAITSNYDELSKNLWNVCRNRARPKLDELAQRIEPNAGWSDLILPDDRKEMLREMVAQIRHRTKVFDQWEFGKNNRGLGLCALFAGTSGTGKTMAAEVLAKELNLDLYRIDLSTVVSKYIGETEKNLSKLFNAAESGGVILLFDEGDALFGKRTEASDSKDRYANMEVSYLLQRIESYNGLAIVTTNIEDSLDSAFIRRLRYIVKFPFPGTRERALIWQKVYPKGVLKDTRPRIFGMLRQMEISGGLIYSIALKSAFIAADQGADGVYLEHIHQAAKSEYTKIGRTLSVSETPWIRVV